MSASETVAAAADAARDRRQAVVVIHGIGDQRPMQTISSFVDAVWLKRPDGARIEDRHAWPKPDTVTGNFDLFQIATNQRDGLRTDFYEFYWADLMSGTRVGAVWYWIFTSLVFVRDTGKIRLAFSWARVVGGVAAIALLAMAAWCFVSVAQMLFGAVAFRPAHLLEISYLLAFVLLNWFVKTYVGDAARYLIARPDNIGARQEIRRRGVRILTALHKDKRYERIVVVGHSLGSVIGYDILTYAFTELTHAITIDTSNGVPPEVAAIDSFRSESFDRDAWRRAQSAALSMKTLQTSWRVSDFVTLGSPLTYANFLVARGPRDFRRRKEQKELPTCPPRFDRMSNARSRVIFQRLSTHEAFIQHSSMFAFTRWTNLYFPTQSFFLRGDVIGGPLAPLFGPGVADRPVHTTHLWGQSIFSHTSYWTQGGLRGHPNHIETLIDSLDL